MSEVPGLDKPHDSSCFGVVPFEAGGLNAMDPIAVGALAGAVCVDGDLMGRAFPELQVSDTAWCGILHYRRNMKDIKELKDIEQRERDRERE